MFGGKTDRMKKDGPSQQVAQAKNSSKNQAPRR
jgi:hypothetical protein